MKLILVRAPLSYTAYEPPLGIMYLASFLRDNGYPDIEIIDCDISPADYESLESVIASRRPDVVGISAISYNIESAYNIARIAKSNGAHVIVGGPHFTFIDIQTLKHEPNIDAAVRGEGEVTLLEYLHRLESNGGRTVEGMTVRKGDKIVRGMDRQFIEQLDDLPFPAWDLVPMEKYQYHSILASRGCPFQCIFCASPAIWKRKLRTRSPENIVDEIEALVKEYGTAKILHIKDDTFTARKKWASDICDEMIRRGLKIKWECMGRVNAIDAGLLQKIKSAGCNTIEFGIESGDSRVLKIIKKDISLASAEHAVALAHNAGLKTGAFFMLGHPGETLESIEETFNFSIALRPDAVAYNPTDILPGTELEKMAKENGIIPNDYDWSKTCGKGRGGFGTSADVPPYTTKIFSRDCLNGYSKAFYLRFALCRLFDVRNAQDLAYLNGAHVPTQFRVRNLLDLKVLFSEIKIAFSRSKGLPRKLVGMLLIFPFLLMLFLKLVARKIIR